MSFHTTVQRLVDRSTVKRFPLQVSMEYNDKFFVLRVARRCIRNHIKNYINNEYAKIYKRRGLFGHRV